MNRSITLKEVSNSSHYKVIKMVNMTTYKIGEYINKDEVNSLLTRARKTRVVIK